MRILNFLCSFKLTLLLVGAGMLGHEHQETFLTRLVGKDIFLKQNRPAVVVSSTSWLGFKFDPI